MDYFVLLFIATVAVCLALFDAILDRQYRLHAEFWREDGRPWGFFSFVREAGFVEGCSARNEVLTEWLLRNPRWAQGDRAAIGLLYAFRLLTAVALALWVVGALALLKLI